MKYDATILPVKYFSSDWCYQNWNRSSSDQYFCLLHLQLTLYFSFKGLRARMSDLQVRHFTLETFPQNSSSAIPWYLSLIVPEFPYFQPIAPLGTASCFLPMPGHV